MKKNQKWERQKFKLPANHGWRTKPGNQIVVAGRGDVRFDLPWGWVSEPGEVSIRFYDRQPPDDDCRVEMSYFVLPPEIDWSELPLSTLFETVKSGEPRDVLEWSEVHTEKRPDLELMWQEIRFIDPGENREARSRLCLARGHNIQPFITMDYWPEHADRFIPVWDEVLRSLTLGDYIKDPLRRILD